MDDHFASLEAQPDLPSDASINTAIHQAESPVRTVTSRPGTPPAERKRQQRERDRQPLLFVRDDWQLFLDPATLGQKVGAQPQYLRQVVLRELVDNGLDAGAQVTLNQGEGGWIISDSGPGLDPAAVPRLFAVNRPLMSSKRRRLPLRGMLGHGLRAVMGAVAASEGSLAVETRGRRLTLAVDLATGTTIVVDDQPIPDAPGLVVYLTFGPRLPPRYSYDDNRLARNAIQLAEHGTTYDGPSSPWWFSSRDLHQLMQQVSPIDTTVGRFCDELGFTLEDDRICRTLDRADATAVLNQLRQGTKPVAPKALGALGRGVYGDDYSYACHTGFTSERDAQIPYVIEAWAHCERPEKRGNGSAAAELLLNRTPSVAKIHVYSYTDRLGLQGCGLGRGVHGTKTGDYQIILGIITPYVDLATDGKEPALSPFSEAIATVLHKVCGAAHRAMEKPPGGMKIKEAAWQVMPAAYLFASSGGTLPANARQVMYAARPDILRLTGKEKLDAVYFTQVLLPDYIIEHPEITVDWDVVFDDRGTFIEPHTGRVVPLGTVEVRQYLGERLMPEISARLDSGAMAPTTGPVNRFRTILFIEKEGFSALLAQAMIAERFDVAIMSTKGMSNVAARMLIDRLAPYIETVLVVHDFDVSGFSIFGTLGSDGRRYKFDNVVRVVDLGLRLSDVTQMGLQKEKVDVGGDWSKRTDTLISHGATDAEIAFLENDRVELNAMPSDVFIQFLERKLTEHGVHKVVPSYYVLEQHARRVIERAFINRAVEEVRAQAEAEAAAVELPEDLHQQVVAALEREPRISWDIAIADIATQLIGGAE
jgi:hypothetical protein